MSDTAGGTRASRAFERTRSVEQPPNGEQPRRGGRTAALRGGRTAALRFAGVVALSALGCGDALGPCGDGERCPPEGQVQVATWWGTRGELFTPFDILKQSLRRRARLEATLAHDHGKKDLHTTWVEQQLDPENPEPLPLDVFSANNGDEIVRWTPCAASGNAPGAPRLLSLTSPELGENAFKRSWIADHLPAEVMDTLACDGEVYALPVGIHRINTIVYNKALFRAAGYEVDGAPDSPLTPLPRTLDELHAAAAALDVHLPEDTSASDLEPSVFAVAGHDPWTLSLFVIENLMLSLAQDASHYLSYWRGEACDERLLEDTLFEFRRLEPWFGSYNLPVDAALERVISGQAAMTVTGDWAAAEAAPEEIGTMPFPGTEQYFVFTADVFAVPDIPSADRWKGLAWLRAVTGDETQLEFSAAKSALPARVELEGELAPDSPNAPEWVPSLPGILPYQGAFTELAKRLEEWLYSGEPTGVAVLDYAREEFPKLENHACPPRAPLH